MRSSYRSVLGLIAVGLLPTPALAQPASFCADLQRVVAAAHENAPFHSLIREGPDFGFRHGCFVTGGRGPPAYLCLHVPPGLEDRLIASTADCLPRAQRLPRTHERLTVFRLEDVDLAIQASDPRSRARPVVQYSVQLRRR